jgi:hypothetical protein
LPNCFSICAKAAAKAFARSAFDFGSSMNTPKNNVFGDI